MGIIDTLSAGFATINRRLWVIVIPISLDLFLWVGPRLSAESLAARALEVYQPMIAAEQAREQITYLLQQLGRSNIFAVLSWQLPSIIAAGTPAPIAEQGILSIGSWGLLLGLLPVLGLTGLFGTCLYLGGIAMSVREEGFDIPCYLRRVWVSFYRLTAYFLLVIGALFIFGMPFAMAVALVGLVSPVVAGFLTLIGLTVLLWTFLYLFFANYAIFVGDRGPLRAIGDSILLVSRHFWSAVALFVLVHVILLGTTIIWSRVLVHPVGVLTAIIGNSYIASGLAAGAMIFYRERVLVACGGSSGS